MSDNQSGANPGVIHFGSTAYISHFPRTCHSVHWGGCRRAIVQFPISGHWSWNLYDCLCPQSIHSSLSPKTPGPSVVSGKTHLDRMLPRVGRRHLYPSVPLKRDSEGKIPLRQPPQEIQYLEIFGRGRAQRIPLGSTQQTCSDQEKLYIPPEVQILTSDAASLGICTLWSAHQCQEALHAATHFYNKFRFLCHLDPMGHFDRLEQPEEHWPRRCLHCGAENIARTPSVPISRTMIPRHQEATQSDRLPR